MGPVHAVSHATVGPVRVRRYPLARTNMERGSEGEKETLHRARNKAAQMSNVSNTRPKDQRSFLPLEAAVT